MTPERGDTLVHDVSMEGTRVALFHSVKNDLFIVATTLNLQPGTSTDWKWDVLAAGKYRRMRMRYLYEIGTRHAAWIGDRVPLDKKDALTTMSPLEN